MARRRTKETELDGLIGTSPAMRKVYALIRKAAKVDLSVLITGETGTGKTVTARLVHDLSARNSAPFVHVNTGTLPAELIPSRIFGHVKGAFTGATHAQLGGFEEANGGTLFLDEVSTMDEHAQATFLRVLDTGAFRRIGGKRDITVDVRVVAATNEDLQQAVREGRFRADLLYRLQVFVINMPPLRACKSDLPLVLTRFLEGFRKEFGIDVKDVSDDAMKLLHAYDWPGNVRELKNVIISAAVITGAHDITPAELPERLRSSARADSGPPRNMAPLQISPPPSTSPDGPADDSDDSPTAPLTEGVFIPVGTRLADAEMAIILKTLRACDDNKTKAAQQLGISRKTLYDKLAKRKLT